jgi:hypothetical protein
MSWNIDREDFDEAVKEQNWRKLEALSVGVVGRLLHQSHPNQMSPSMSANNARMFVVLVSPVRSVMGIINE